MHEQRSGQGCVRRGDEKRDELVASDIDAERAGRVLAAGDRRECAAEARGPQAHGTPGRQCHDDGEESELGAIGEDLEAADADRRDARYPHIAAGDGLPLHRDLVDDQPDRQGGHGEIVALEPQCGIADDESDRERERHARQERADRRPAIGRGEHCRGVTAERSERVVAERHLAGIAHEQVEADHEHGVDQRERHHGDEIAAGHEGVTEDRECHDPRECTGECAEPLRRDNTARGRHGRSRCVDRSRQQCARATSDRRAARAAAPAAPSVPPGRWSVLPC